MARDTDISRDPARIRSMFSKIAPRYDFGNHLLSANVDRLWRRRAAKLGVTSDTRRVLDCCAGTCDLTLAFARRMNGDGHVVGCDFAQPMLTIAQTKIEKTTAPAAVSVAAADTLSLPFADDTFDVATVAFGLRNVADWDAGLREMRRVIRPGGCALILEFTQPPNPFLRALYYLYFKRLLPIVAVLGAGSKDYGYLPASVVKFPGPSQLASMMKDAGFHDVSYELLTFGIAAIHIGQK